MMTAGAAAQPINSTGFAPLFRASFTPCLPSIVSMTANAVLAWRCLFNGFPTGVTAE